MSSPPDGARKQRAQLMPAIQHVEHALAVAVAESGWRGTVIARLAALRDAFAEHEARTEGTFGLYAEMLAHAPSLAYEVDWLVRDHARLRYALDALWVRAPGARPQELRAWAADLLRDLDGHRQRGADLVYKVLPGGRR